MHGDFSKWFPKTPVNQVGILAQEGRLLIDADVNAQSLLALRWQDLAARDAFGAGIAAIPADDGAAWQITSAQLVNGNVQLTVMPGRAWADGLLVELPGAAPVTLTAMPVGLPIQTPPTDLGASGTRDAVVLEVWRQALSGFQAPAELVEPALGGPDTAERIETCYALRLYRMAATDTCRSIVGALQDSFATRGKLNVTLAPTTTNGGDCPVVAGGGYSGFEHDLYRIEIADVNSGGAPQFKWSQWNGGLVGRGTYDSTAKKVTITGNDQAIQYSGLNATQFYFEALVRDTTLGHWRVAYGAVATFDSNGLIDLSGPATYGTIPSGTLCFRIWNGIRLLSDFPAATSSTQPKELRDGIRLEFDPNATYVAGDYWTFSVRAGLSNPATLVAHAPPFGVHHHRVVLAELDWGTGQLTAASGIEDCRIPFHPLTATDGCCTHSVGDGVTSFGDYTSINAAIAALPDTGGRVCVLPGTYTENVVIQGRANIEVHGCGWRSIITAPAVTAKQPAAAPVIRVVDSNQVRIENLQIVAGTGGSGITFDTLNNAEIEDIAVIDCLVITNTGGDTSGSGIEIWNGANALVRGNHVQANNNDTNPWAGITVLADVARIEHNHVEVVVPQTKFDLRRLDATLGGIWLRGGCSSIDVFENTITGGIGHGIILGSVAEVAAAAAAKPAGAAPAASLAIDRATRLGWIYNKALSGDCVGCGDGTVSVPPNPTQGGPTWTADDPLQLIRIKRNTISQMGMAGIGVFGFLPTADGVIEVDHLEIAENQITGCLTRELATPAQSLAQLSGFGAISLATVVQATIRNNEIRANGTTASTGVCGIYILHGQGLEISGNRIYDNGPQVTTGGISNGTPHGGIWIQSVTAPGIDPVSGDPATPRLSAALRGNEVQAPNGPALVMTTLGDVQVVANAFSSASSDGYQLGDNAINTVAIVTLDTWEAAASSLGQLRTGTFERSQTMKSYALAGQAVDPSTLTAQQIAGLSVTLTPPTASPDAVFLPPPGSVLFADNCCVLSLQAKVLTASVGIIGLTNVQFIGNLSAANVSYMHFPVAMTAADAVVSNNRLVGGDFAGFGLYSLCASTVNAIVTNNLADHCIAVTAQNAVVNAQNIELDTSGCIYWKPLFTAAGIKGVAS